MQMDMSFLKDLGIEKKNYGASYGEWIRNTQASVLKSITPINGETIAEIYQAGPDEYDTVINQAQKAFQEWRNIPAPRRGEIVRLIGLELRKYKDLLGKLDQKGVKKMSISDEDARFMRSHGHIELSYNAQCATENQTVLAYDLNNQAHDRDQ